MFRLNISPKSLKRIPLKLIPYALLLLLLACPEPEPEPPAPQKADCPNGQLPCEEDSTICCDVICPPGTLLGGEDSTECIPVECPEYYYLCGEDSTDCCLENTSHDIYWEIDTLIFTESRFIKYYVEEVVFINDNMIWIVGDFLIPDTTGNMTDFERSFNQIKWNGIDWVMDRVMEADWSSIAKAEAIFALSVNEVWVGNYGSPMYWNGNEWQLRGADYGWESVGGYINAIWGSGADDIFFVSVNGQVNHWNGSGFNRMETPTETLLSDIQGTGSDDVWAVGRDVTTGDVTLIHYNGTEWSLMYEGGLAEYGTYLPDSVSGALRSIESFEDGLVNILTSNGIYVTSSTTAPSAELIQNSIWAGSPIKMRGNHANDLFICGQHSVLTHYNGESYYFYSIPEGIDFRHIDVRHNKIVAIGWISNGAVAVRGIR